MKNLIIYYTYEGATEKIATSIAEVIDADILKLTPQKEKKTKSLFRFIWGGIQVYMTKKPKLEEYKIDINKYDNIFIGTPCWFGTYAPPINTFLTENKITNKNIYLFVCNGGNLRNTWKNFEEALQGNNIISKLDLVYPLKNGLTAAQQKAQKWATNHIQEKQSKNNVKKTTTTK